MKQITLITGNPHKAQQISRYLKMPVLHIELDLEEIQSVDIEEVIQHKSKQAYQHVKGPVIVDDSGITIEELGRLPGAFSKFFNREIGAEKICKIMKIFENKNATGRVIIGYYDGKNLLTFLGETEGKIAEKPGGNNNVGFGYDFYFIPDGYSQTRSEMSQEDYDKSSPRRKALEKLAEYLQNND